MSVFSHPEFDHHEQVMYCHDEATGLFGIIAIHSTALGPAAGGCRMYPYASLDDALTDVLRLSRGMSYKNALADLPLGGGKCVIIADPAPRNKADLLRAFSHHVQAIGGRYWTAIDVGEFHRPKYARNSPRMLEKQGWGMQDLIFLGWPCG